jgi:hypothetical protein
MGLKVYAILPPTAHRGRARASTVSYEDIQAIMAAFDRTGKIVHLTQEQLNDDEYACPAQWKK